MRCRYVPVMVVVLLASAWAQVEQSRIYSNVEYNQEGGDLLGVEMQISIDHDRAVGQLKIYEGGCAEPIEVSGSSAASKIDVSGVSDAFGKIILSGVIRNEDFNGILQLKKAESSETIHLKRIPKPHC